MHDIYYADILTFFLLGVVLTLRFTAGKLSYDTAQDVRNTSRESNSQFRRIRPITRVHRASRGLANRRNDCFRNSALQALMHAPRFLNWILSHNEELDGVIRFPCREHAEVQQEIESEAMHLDGQALSSKSILSDCPACAMKGFVQEYWGDHRRDQYDCLVALNPKAGAYKRLVQVDVALLQFTPEAGIDGVQQDPDEFQSRYLQACLESVDYRRPEHIEWKRHFATLFKLDIEVTWTCACGALQPLPFGTAEAEAKMTLSILPEGQNDSVKASIHRKFSPETLGVFQCSICDLWCERTKRVCIDTSPELLCVKLEIADQRGGRNNNPIGINGRLDLTQYQSVWNVQNAPLKYRLIGVLYHKGRRNDGGHWFASVRGPEHVYEMNDTIVTPLDWHSQLLENPRRGAQAVVLMYQRVHPTSGRS